jgi:hypothetical protein
MSKPMPVDVGSTSCQSTCLTLESLVILTRWPEDHLLQSLGLCHPNLYEALVSFKPREFMG